MTINSKRIIHLIGNDIRTKGRTYLLITAVSFSILTYFFFNSNVSFLQAAGALFNGQPSFGMGGFGLNNDAFKYHLIWFPSAFLLIASVLTSLSFTELSTRDSAQFHLSLPASILEKWLSKVILYVLIIPAILLILYFIFAQFTYKWDGAQVRLGVTDPFLWKHIRFGILAQCIVLLGGLFFRSFSFFKIALSGVGLYILYNVIQVISFVIINDHVDLFRNGGTIGLNSLHEILGRARYHTTMPHSISDFLGMSNLSLLAILAGAALGLSFVKYRELES